MNKGPGRKKHWSELNDDEKNERMRKEIKALQATIVTQRKELNMLFNHSHVNGEIVTTIERYGREEASVPQVRNDDVYF